VTGVKNIVAVLMMLIPSLASAEKTFDTEITINGGHLTVAIESGGTLTVNGSSSTITADKLDSGSVNGSNNKITWKKSAGAGGKPEVSTLGQNNTITQAK